MQIYIDADSMPKEVRIVIQRACLKHSINLYYVANKKIPFDMDSQYFFMIIQDNADQYLIDNVKESDIVITRDIPLANSLLDQSSYVLNDRGLCFDKNNIIEKMRQRDVNELLSSYISRPKRMYNKKDLEKFSACFDKIFQKKLREKKKS